MRTRLAIALTLTVAIVGLTVATVLRRPEPIAPPPTPADFANESRQVQATDQPLSTHVPATSEEPDTAHADASLTEPPEQVGAITGEVIDKTVTYHPERLGRIMSDLYDPRDEERARRAYETIFEPANRPVENVRIRLKGENTSKETTTNAAGAFTFGSVAFGLYTVSIEPPRGVARRAGFADGFAKTVRVGPERESTATFDLHFDGIEITGRITNQQGQPIAGATVEAEPRLFTHGGEGRLKSESATASSDADGRYTLRHVMPANSIEAGQYLYGGHLPEYGATYAIQVRAVGYAPSEQLVPAITASLADFAVAFTDEVERLGYAEDRRTPLYLDSELPMPDSEGNVIRHVDFVLDPAAAVSGTAVDSDNVPIVDAAISLIPSEERHQKTPLSQQAVSPEGANTDDAGGFLFNPVPAGVYEFQIVRQQVQRARNGPFSLAAGQRIVDVIAVFEADDERATLVGHVQDELTGHPVEDFAVTVTEVISATEPNPVHGRITKSDETPGAFRIDQITAGQITARVNADGYAPLEVTAAVEPAQESEIVVNLSPAGEIEGVISVSGVPGSGMVRAYRTDGEQILHPHGYHQDQITGHADEFGHYTVSALPMGEYRVQAEARPPGPGVPVYRHAAAIADVQPGRVTTVNIDAKGGETLQGTLEFPDLYTAARVNLIEGDRVGQTYEQYRFNLVATTESMRESGSFVFPSLPPGDYTLTAFCYNRRDIRDRSQEPEPPRIWQRVTIVPGEAAEVALRIVVP